MDGWLDSTVDNSPWMIGELLTTTFVGLLVSRHLRPGVLAPSHTWNLAGMRQSGPSRHRGTRYRCASGFGRARWLDPGREKCVGPPEVTKCGHSLLAFASSAGRALGRRSVSAASSGSERSTTPPILRLRRSSDAGLAKGPVQISKGLPAVGRRGVAGPFAMPGLANPAAQPVRVLSVVAGCQRPSDQVLPGARYNRACDRAADRGAGYSKSCGNLGRTSVECLPRLLGLGARSAHDDEAGGRRSGSWGFGDRSATREFACPPASNRVLAQCKRDLPATSFCPTKRAFDESEITLGGFRSGISSPFAAHVRVKGVALFRAPRCYACFAPHQRSAPAFRPEFAALQLYRA